MRLVLVAAGVLVLAGCGTATSAPRVAADGPVERPTAVPAADGPVTTTYPLTVIDQGDGPVACLGGVADSLPPQCQGVPLRGWDWAAYDGKYERRGDVRWGDFQLTGTFDGSALTVTKAVASDDLPPMGVRAYGPEMKTPCPEPAGGWRVLDPATSDEAALSRLQQVAGQRDDYAMLWVDQSVNPAWADATTGPTDEGTEAQLNDPRQEIVNVQVTTDPAAAEADFREIWGGMLCVTQVAHSGRELAKIQQQTMDLPGLQGSSGGTIDNHVELTVTYDDGSYQRWADATYGPGTVVVTSALSPAG